MTSPPFTLRSVQAFGYRYPLTMPVITSFGRMKNRPAVFVRVEDGDGNIGWGEVWCNFPAPGAEHRVRLVNEVLAPALVGFNAREPSDGARGPVLPRGRRPRHGLLCEWKRELRQRSLSDVGEQRISEGRILPKIPVDGRFGGRSVGQQLGQRFVPVTVRSSVH